MAEPDDPFLLAMAPPAFETPTQRAEREAEEEKARRMSELIDEQIQKDMLELRKRAPVKVLLLGQENCGTSTFVSFVLRFIVTDPDVWVSVGLLCRKGRVVERSVFTCVYLTWAWAQSHSCQVFGFCMRREHGK